MEPIGSFKEQIVLSASKQQLADFSWSVSTYTITHVKANFGPQQVSSSALYL